MSFYKTHIFICTNQKDGTKRCCANHGGKEIVDYAKQQAALLGLTKEKKCRISSSGCMGRCEEGPVIAVYPQGDWYTYQSKADIDKILENISNSEVCLENMLEP